MSESNTLIKNFHLDFGSPTVPFNHYWELCVGSCHALTALREDYRRQLEQCHKELGFKYVRFHGLFDDDMSVLLKGGTLLAREEGDFVLSFTNTDSIFDFLLSIGMKPFIELGFMPSALSSGSCTIFHYQSHTSPPDDYGKWQWLVEQFTAHCVERYGLGEVRQWFFEVWNEPNLGSPDSPMGFWGGTKEDYFKLYTRAAAGVKKVDPRLRVGGPATSDAAWIKEFVQYCRDSGTPVDFVSTHNYPTDFAVGYRHGSGKKLFDPGELAKSAAMTPEQRAEMIREFIQQDQDKWRIVPRGILTAFCREAREEAAGLPLYYTEWNSGGGIESDGPFGASFILKTCLDNHGLAEGYSYWTFTDIFEEQGMPHTPFHGGFGLLNLQGIPKASYRAFEILHRLGNELYETKLAEGTVDVYAVKKAESACIQILAVNHQSLGQGISTEDVAIRVSGLPAFAEARVEQIDGNHGNALGRWRELGSPDYPSPEAVYDLLSASGVRPEKLDCRVREGAVDIQLRLPEQGAALVTIYY
ncbi:MAG: hypothetical protein LBF77_10020 [Spirochaetaceae bacterium]|jgi:xylan 1,4-beta-xylosidase|nr:hypothetical protein [Spirochaetaceae bacterium]